MDRKTFEALYDQHHRLVFGIALRVLNDQAAAEDVTQAVFLKVWSAPEAFRGGNFGAWLARVTRNHALDVVRSKSLRQTEQIPDDLPLDDSIVETVMARLDRARVHDALKTLPDEQSLPITLGFFGGITHEEIACKLHVPLGTIKSRIRMGLRRLRAELEAQVSL